MFLRVSDTRRTGRLRAAGCALCVAALLGAPSLGAAETLQEAIKLAYQTNPDLRAQQAQLRATDEGVVQAKAAGGPQVALQGQLAYEDAAIQEPASLFSAATTTRFRTETNSIDLSIVQPLYSGGGLTAQLHGAEASVFAGREAVRQAEAQLILNVVTAYCDARRDRAAVGVVEEEIAFLRSATDETNARGRLGALSKTDVAQAQARLLVSQSDLQAAQSRLAQSNAEYLNVVGQSPGELAPEPDLPGLPTDVDQAFDAALKNNAQLLQALDNEQAAREKVNQAKTAFRPTISMRIDAQEIPTEPYLPRQYDRNVTGALVISQPIYTSGANSSKVRQAADMDSQAALTVESTRRQVVRLVSDAWAQHGSAQKAIELQVRVVDLEKTALEGNRIEARAGLRTTIDLLNAEAELVNAQQALLQSRHDAYVANATLLAAMGLLETQFVAPGADLYSPQRSMSRVEGIDAAPWEGAIVGFDGLGGPTTHAPNLSPPEAGSQRPTPTPADAPPP
jgi:outer membrane protein